MDRSKPTGTFYGGNNVIVSGGSTKEKYIKFVASDAYSPIDKVYVRKPGSGSYVTCANESQFSDNGTYYFYCTDIVDCNNTFHRYKHNQKTSMAHNPNTRLRQTKYSKILDNYPNRDVYNRIIFCYRSIVSCKLWFGIIYFTRRIILLLPSVSTA